MPTVVRPGGRFRAGDWAVWTAGASRHVVRILEDVGPVGRRGVRFYRFREQVADDEFVESEMSDDYLEPARPDEIPAAG